MEITDLFGYVGALIIGIILGLIGGGGSILTVPIFVYLIHINPITATAYSLFVVGISALVGSINTIKKRLVCFRTAIVFAIPAFISVYLTRKYIIPVIPNPVVTIDTLIISKERAIMIFFALIMIVASISMIKGKNKETATKNKTRYNYVLILIEGIIVGILTGLVGAGGGFLIIPALVILAKLPMKKAVATSLLIIAIKSLIGFIGDIQNMTINWVFLLSFTGVSILGIFLGLYFSNFIEGKKLKKTFGWFVLIMGIYILSREFM